MARLLRCFRLPVQVTWLCWASVTRTSKMDRRLPLLPFFCAAPCCTRSLAQRLGARQLLIQGS
eukprot:14707253-Alexandrium_andersonii.AAC.1